MYKWMTLASATDLAQMQLQALSDPRSRRPASRLDTKPRGAFGLVEEHWCCPRDKLRAFGAAPQSATG